MKPALFEYPQFHTTPDGETRILDGVKLDDTATRRLNTVVKSEKTPAPVRKTLSKYVARGNDAVVAGVKSLQVNPLLGARSNVFGLCDAVEYGYGIYTDPTDYINSLLSWLDPAIISDRRKLDIPILDFRRFFNGGVSGGSINDVLCGPPANFQARRGDIGRCRIQYCFDEDPRVYRYCIDAAALSDFQRDCWQKPPLNIFGETFADDPSQQSRLDDFILMTGVRRLMAQKMLTGSWGATGTNWDGTPVQESTGLLNFVEDFPTRHPELAGNCECLLPKTIALPPCPPANADACAVQEYWNSVYRIIENRMIEIEELLMRGGGNASIPQDYWLMVLNWQDARCIQWQQACLKFCGNTQYMVQIEPGQLSSAQVLAANDFYNRFTQGAFGAGRIFLPSGRIIDIWAHPMMDYHPVDNPNGIQRGDIHLFCKGWTGSGLMGSNRNAIRPVATQFTRYFDYLRGRMYGAERFELMMNGTAIKVRPLNPCDNVCVLFNIDVGFSNAPWMQTKFEGLCPCDEVPPIASWACNMPAITPNALCAPTNI